MTRAETIDAIRKQQKAYGPHPEHRVPDCKCCTIAWLLQELDYRDARLTVAAYLLGDIPAPPPSDRDPGRGVAA